MEAVDGNAIAGELREHFGGEMTGMRGRCGHCGAGAQIAELAVYESGPGTVVRCRSCWAVVIVLVRIHEELRVDMSAFELARP